MTKEELQQWAVENLPEEEKIQSLNLGQLEAVYKIRTFLEKESRLTWQGKTYTGKDEVFEPSAVELILEEENKHLQLEMCKQYVIQNSFLLTGAPGVGKTFSSEVAVSGYKFVYCAPTFQACAVLYNNTRASKVHTLASALGTSKLDRVTNDQSSDDFYLRSMESIQKATTFGNDVPVILRASWLLIDEASMVGGNNKPPQERRLKEDGEYRTVLLSNDTFVAIAVRLLDRVNEYEDLPEKFLFLGDIFQTPPVGTEDDNDATLLEELMKREDQHYSLTEIMRTDCPDIKVLLTSYLNEMTRLNELRDKSGILSSSPTAATNLHIVPLPERQNSENVYYYNNQDSFINQFLYLYRNRPVEHKYDPNYVSIVNFNNEVHSRTVQLVKKIRSELFGDPSVKYYKGETLLFRAGYEVPDKVTGKILTFEKDSRVFVEDVSEGVKTGRLGKGGPAYSIALPRLTVIGGAKTATFYVASDHFVKTVTTIRNGNRYRERMMHLLPDEVEYFGLRSDKLSYSHWLELSSIVPDFGYAYVVNNFKVQGSSLQYTMVDESNILTSPASPKKLLQYIYTGLSRGRQKVFIYHIGNKVNTDKIIETIQWQRKMSIEKDSSWEGGPVDVIEKSVFDEIPYDYTKTETT